MSVVAAVESDFSVRKLKIAGICLMGQLFGTSMLIIGRYRYTIDFKVMPAPEKSVK